MANFLQRLKISGYERKLKSANRKSFYQEEAVSMGPATRAGRFFQEGQYWQSACQAYEIILRYYDYSNAFYYLGMSLVRLGEVEIGMRHLRDAILTSLRSMDTIDPKYADDFLAVCREHDRTIEGRSFFEQLAEKEPKARSLVKSLQYQGKL